MMLDFNIANLNFIAIIKEKKEQNLNNDGNLYHMIFTQYPFLLLEDIYLSKEVNDRHFCKYRKENEYWFKI